MEPFFLLGYYFGMDWKTYYNFPVAYKRWLIERIGKEIEKSHNNKDDIQTKAPHHNTPEIRSLANKVKTTTPNARLQRFT